MLSQLQRDPPMPRNIVALNVTSQPYCFAAYKLLARKGRLGPRGPCEHSFIFPVADWAAGEPLEYAKGDLKLLTICSKIATHCSQLKKTEKTFVHSCQRKVTMFGPLYLMPGDVDSDMRHSCGKALSHTFNRLLACRR
jgi:hypothetical protein